MNSRRKLGTKHIGEQNASDVCGLEPLCEVLAFACWGAGHAWGTSGFLWRGRGDALVCSQLSSDPRLGNLLMPLPFGTGFSDCGEQRSRGLGHCLLWWLAHSGDAPRMALDASGTADPVP